MKKLTALTILWVGCAASGCVEIPILLGLGNHQPGNGSTPSDGNGAAPDNDGNSVGPLAILSASTLAPAVGEEVTLSCRAARDPIGTLSFSFQSTATALNIDAQSGTARFVVSDADVNAEIPVTCRATDDSGTGPVSNRVVILPFSADPLEDPAESEP